MYCRCNPTDDELRRAEREAATGDPLAAQRYQLLLSRTGDPGAIITVMLTSLLEKLNDWASRDGRSILRGHHSFDWHGEHRFEKFCMWVSSVRWDEESSCYQLRWEQTIEIDEEPYEALEKKIQDIRLLRPVNEVKVEIEIAPPPSDNSHHGKCAKCGRGTDRVTEPSSRGLCYDCQYGQREIISPPNASVNYINCEWYPELIRAGSSWHSGWHEYHRPVARAHPLFEIEQIILQHLGTSVASGGPAHPWSAMFTQSSPWPRRPGTRFGRQDGPTDRLVP